MLAAGAGHSHTATGVGMTLEEALAQIEKQKSEIEALKAQVQNADPEGHAARADALSAEIVKLESRITAKESNAKKAISEKEAAEKTAKERLARIQSLEKELEEAAGGDIDVNKIKTDATSKAAKDTAAKIRADEVAPLKEENERLKAENERLQGSEDRRNKTEYLTQGLVAAGIKPNKYKFALSEANSVFSRDEDGRYVARNAQGELMSGKSGLLTPEEFFADLGQSDPDFLLKPTGGNPGSGAKQIKQESKGKLKPGTAAHRAFMNMNASPAEFAKLYGPGGQYS